MTMEDLLRAVEGAPNIASAQVSVDTTTGGVVLAAARQTRRRLILINHGATDVFVGTGTVSTANGALLLGTKGTVVILNTNAAVKGITGGSSVTVGVIEEFD